MMDHMVDLDMPKKDSQNRVLENHRIASKGQFDLVRKCKSCKKEKARKLTA
jgi:hypothetical protein